MGIICDCGGRCGAVFAGGPSGASGPCAALWGCGGRLLNPVEDLLVGEHTDGHEEPYGVVADEACKRDQPLQQQGERCGVVVHDGGLQMCLDATGGAS